MKKIFNPADILIPRNADMTAWSVVACDQFTSEPEYWARAEALVGDKPSTLRLMLPEAYLGKPQAEDSTARINAAMRRYLDGGLFWTLENSYVYVERTISDGRVRRGLVGALDLEEYDWSPASASPIRATEGTVEDRLPPRVKVRQDAPLEMPHIMVFIDDADNAVMDAAQGGEKVYDFDLMLGGGHLAGYRVPDNARVDAAVDALSDPAALAAKYGLAGKAPAIFAMGDGNHSLATAKKCWEALKPALTPARRETHPARFALVELVNIHDPAISFEPIHKVLFDTDNRDFIAAAKLYFHGAEGEGHVIRLLAGGAEATLSLAGFSIGELIGECERFCQRYLKINGGRIDYVHGDGEAASLASGLGCAGILLPRMEKSELFPSVIQTGPFPKKSFSIGLGPDKRYYLECRKIR
ncbi:MAG TPA: DUF1015 domain-containing protein [Oscillospiraceae bacterium]|nr:DUF1015 domain-containing protein [Oscillospiraceae bacterium]HPS75244.1 DUF1015 domain-containing protein [Oscillospiraceae bacterium]